MSKKQVFLRIPNSRSSAKKGIYYGSHEVSVKENIHTDLLSETQDERVIR